MEWYLKVVRDNYANFKGRARRKEYWMFVLFNIIFGGFAMILDVMTGLGFIDLIYTLAVLIPSIAVAFRRLHDVGKSGWFNLILLIPLIGLIWIIILMCKDGDQEENKYGSPPKIKTAETEETA